MAAVNPNLSARENFVAMINETAKYTFTGKEINISPAVEINSQAEWSHGRNSMVVIEAIPDSGFVGEKTLFYDRCNVRDQVTLCLDKESIVIYHFYSLELIKSLICKACRMIEDQIEIVGRSPRIGEISASYKLKAVAGSLVYTGEITIVIDIVPSVELSGATLVPA